MNALEEELAEQIEDSRRAPFRSVADIRAFVSDEYPSATTNVSLDMCAVSVNEGLLNYRLELVDYEFAERIDEAIPLLDKLDKQRRSKFVFLLTLWKPKKRAITEGWEFIVGKVYHFNNVHSLCLFHAMPQGSVQLHSEQCVTKKTSRAEETPDAFAKLQLAASEMMSKSSEDRKSADTAVVDIHKKAAQGQGEGISDLNPSPKKRSRASKRDVGK